MKIFNRKTEKAKRKSLRNNMPKAEVMLWSKLKGKQMQGYKFRRQHSIGKFIVDFYCPKLKLAIEIDGDSHAVNEKPKLDYERQRFIEAQGVGFLRFTNNDIYKNADGVLKAIEEFVKENEINE